MQSVERLLTMHLGPSNAPVATEVRVDPQLSIPDVEAAIDRVEQRIDGEYPIVGQIFIEGQRDTGGARFPGGVRFARRL